MKPIIIKIPFKTPTINHLYWHRGNIKIMKKQAVELREKIKKLIPEELKYLKGKRLSVSVEIYENWFTKKGEVKKKDLSNREKFLVDSVFDSLDDKFIFEHTMKKIQSEEEYSIIKIKQMNF